jgi:hypothetical protein
MESVFYSWNPEIMEYFIEKGADLEKGYPLAHAFCSKIRTALSIFKKYKARFTSFQEQVNIALRYHSKEGNLKWVSLMLWAGADPYARGLDSPWDTDDPDDYRNALELATTFGHFEIFKLKSIKLNPQHPYAEDLLRRACDADSAELLERLFSNGFSPSQMEDKGECLIQSLACDLSWYLDLYSWSKRPNKNIDRSSSREKMKMIHLLLRNGARWDPDDDRQIEYARRSFLKMTPDYIMEFIWLLTGYRASSRKTIEQLLRTPSIRALVGEKMVKINEMLAKAP